MFSVFSNYLNPFIDEGLLQDTDQSRFENVYELLRIAYNQGASGVIHTTKFFVPDGEDYKADELLYEIWRNKDLQDIVDWFNSKIIPEFLDIDYRTKCVRLRIALSKMEKLMRAGKLRKDYFIMLSDNLARTLHDEHFSLINEDLPF